MKKYRSGADDAKKLFSGKVVSSTIVVSLSSLVVGTSAGVN